MAKVVVELSDKDTALAFSILDGYGRDLELSGMKVQAQQVRRIAEALCNAQCVQEWGDAGYLWYLGDPSRVGKEK